MKINKNKTIDENIIYLLDAGYSIDEIYKNIEIKPSKKAIAFDKLSFIIKGLNNGWYPNWENESEYKYYPYFKISDNGGFSCWTAAYRTDTNVPSALYLKNEELVKYMVEHHLDLYKDLYE